MTKKQHLENLKVVCGSKTKEEMFEWFDRVVNAWCIKNEGTENYNNFAQAIWIYLKNER